MLCLGFLLIFVGIICYYFRLLRGRLWCDRPVIVVGCVGGRLPEPAHHQLLHHLWKVSALTAFFNFDIDSYKMLREFKYVAH